MPIRPARPGDAPQIGEVHVRAWRETYRGIMPDATLDELKVDERALRWAGVIDTLGQRRQALWVAEDDRGRIAGFAGGGPAREASLTTAGEIYAINIVRQGQRQRVGANLMLAMAVALKTFGFRDAGLWVLAGNENARAFYARLGGVQAAEKERDFDGVALMELGIVWRDIEQLCVRAGALVRD